MKAKQYQALILSTALLAFPIFQAFAGNGGNGGGDGKTTKFEFTSETPTVTFTFKTEPNTDVNIADIKVGGGVITGYDYDRTTGIIKVTVDHGDVPVTGGGGTETDRTDWGGTIEIVGIDNISGVAVNEGNTTTQTLKPANTGNNFSDGESNDETGDVSKSSLEESSKEEEGQINVPNHNIPGGMNESRGGDVEVFPNPIIDQTNIVTVGEILVRTVSVTDMSGRKQKEVNLNGGVDHFSLDLSGFTPGIYILTFDTTAGTFVKKVKKM